MLLFGLALAAARPARAVQQTESPLPRADNPQSSVLFLSLEDFTQPYVRLMFEAFSKAVLVAPNAPAIYFEAIDAMRFERKEYFNELRELLRHKYRDTRIDLVVPNSEAAVAFLAEGRGEPWPKAGVLFLESVSMRVDTRTLLPQAGGMLMDDPFFDFMDDVKRILPDTKRVALVYGASSLEAARWGGYPEKVRKANLEPIELIGLSLEDTRAAVVRLPPQTVVLVMHPSVDAQGHVVPPGQSCEFLSSIDNLPTFALGSQDFGCGIVGGRMRDWSLIGTQLGELALARLKHPSAEVVHVPVEKFTRLRFDDRQLARTGIPEYRLPAGSAIEFRRPNLWRDYRALVLAAMGVTLVQSLLIAGLVFEHRRRRRAELDSRRNLAAMAHLDRRAAMGELATSLAHELNQPLNAILQNAGVAQMMLAKTALPPALDEITDIISDIRKDDIRASEVIRRMRGLLQKRELESQPVDLNDVAEEALAIVRPDARARGVQLERDQGDVPPILGDRVHLQQVLLNLLMNAMDAVAALPPERRHVRVATSERNGDVHLAVTDTGRGIPADGLAQIFEPFFTTKSAGSGMGMGLAIARGIIDAHAGHMGAENNAGGGATVWFAVPKSPKAGGLD